MDEENNIELFRPGPGAIERRTHALPAFPEALEVDQGVDLLAYWRVLRQRRWTILTIFFVVFALVAIWTLRQKPIYRAQALLEIEKENPDILTVQELFEVDTVSDAYLETQYKVLKSEALAERVIDQLGLDRTPEFGSARSKPLWSWPWSEKKTSPGPQTFAVDGAATQGDPDVHQNAVEHFENRLEVTPVRRSRLVAISFDSQDPALAARVINALASDYIDQNLEARWQATQKASEWLSRQLLDLKAKLEKSEDELQKYASDNGLLFLETEKGSNENIVNERLRQLQEELTKAQATRYEKESLYRLVQAGDYASLPGIFEDRLMQDLTVQLADLQRQYAQLSTTFSPSYPKVKQVQNQIKEVEAVLTRERKHAAQKITDDYLAAVNREKLVRNDFERQQREANLIAERSVQYNILKREVDTNKNLYEGLLQRLKEAGVSAGLKASNIRIVDPGKPPNKPAKPRVPLNLALGAILGLALGVGLAFLQECVDKTVKSPGDVQRLLHLPALAFIPSVKALNGHRARAPAHLERGKSLTLSLSGSNGGQQALGALRATQYHRIDVQQADPSLSEAFRNLRTSVLLSTASYPPASILVTSAQPREGKTTVATNLAIALAELGQRVLLVDADMRRPIINKIFDIRARSSLVGYLLGQHDWRPMAQATGVDGLDVLLCGPTPSNPVELLSSERMRMLVWEAVRQYKFVIMDSPPLLNVADSRILASLAEAVVLVVNSAATPRELVQHAETQVRSVGANVVGVVLNNLDFREDSYYRYYRHDYYTRRSSGSAKT